MASSMSPRPVLGLASPSPADSFHPASAGWDYSLDKGKIMHTAKFECVQSRGSLYSHDETYAAPDGVTVQELADERFVDQMGVVRRYLATSPEPFDVTITSDHVSTNSDGSAVDLSETRVVKSSHS